MRARQAFSLVEMVMIVTIISILSAIAVPRLTHASATAQAKSLVATINAVREAMELFHAEHGQYPGYNPSTDAPDGVWFHRQMLEYSNERGNTQGTLAYPFIYGPYLRAPFPKNPFNGLDTVRVIQTRGTSVPLGSSGWIAVLSTGEFRINTASGDLEKLGIPESQIEVMVDTSGSQAI